MTNYLQKAARAAVAFLAAWSAASGTLALCLALGSFAAAFLTWAHGDDHALHYLAFGTIWVAAAYAFMWASEQADTSGATPSFITRPREWLRTMLARAAYFDGIPRAAFGLAILALTSAAAAALLAAGGQEWIRSAITAAAAAGLSTGLWAFRGGFPKMSAADRAVWRNCRTIADVGERTAQWLEGTLKSQPGYWPNTGPDPESEPLISVLAQLNRAGFVTRSSQPGFDGTGYDGRRWQQRAAVTGFATDATVEWLTEALAGTDFVIQDCVPCPSNPFAWGDAAPVTLRGIGVHTDFGYCEDDIPDAWTGMGACHPDAVAELEAARRIVIYDPHWGRNILFNFLQLGARGALTRPRKELTTN